jgi:alcohol dehydrogenase class IV
LCIRLEEQMMWYFNSPRIVFGDDALCHLAEISGRRAFIVTDPNIARLGFVKQVQTHLETAGIESAVFAEVEPDPSLQTAQRCAAAMTEFRPDWIIGLGGGSSIDTAKAAWLLYECPDVDPAGINPFDHFGLRAKAHLIAIPTTSGTGAEVTIATVLTDTETQCKLGLGSYELMPDIAIIDPSLVMGLPPQITADTGLDALTHAIEGYTSSYHNDFTDGLCLKAIDLVFTYLVRAYEDGSDADAREHMHNAATIAGLGFGNSMAALAHAMGHSLGALFHTPHGRAVGLFLPYTIAFTAKGGESRYAEIARHLRLPAKDETEGAAQLAGAIRQLQHKLKEPISLAELGITPQDFEEAMPQLLANAESDTSLVMSIRIPTSDELERLFHYAYEGKSVDF